MNKQAITFLSLFSLILVLSVYYLLLPPNETTVSKTLSPIEQLQSELNEKRESIELKNQEIIAKETSTTESIKLALTTIKENKEAAEIESKVNELVKNLGYNEVFSEIEGEIINITIVKTNATSTDASAIIKAVLNELGDNYRIQVKFIEQ